MKKELNEKRKLLEAVGSMREMNPMLGLRGCRLGLLFPEINVMQTRAILEAARELAKEGKKLHPKIMIPLVGHVNELKEVRRQLEAVPQRSPRGFGRSHRVQVRYHDRIATCRPDRRPDCARRRLLQLRHQRPDADHLWLSAATTPKANSCSSTLMDWKSRASKDKVKILPVNPFQTLDRDGVGQLGTHGGRERPQGQSRYLELGICGEHGGDPDSIEFCHMIGLDYVSCSPFRVPVARLAAAQAALTTTEKDR